MKSTHSGGSDRMLPLPIEHPAHPLHTLQWPDPPVHGRTHSSKVAFKNSLGPLDLIGPVVMIIGLIALFCMGSGK
jgi:hypothetical protein